MSKKENDIFFLCSLIEFISRETKNKRAYIVNKLGEEKINHIYCFADVYHSENIKKVSCEFIEKAKIEIGEFDNVKECKYSLPTYFDIGKIYSKIILAVMKNENLEVSEAVLKVYNSFISDKIDNYNSAFYYDNVKNLIIYYYEGMPYDKSLGASYKNKI